MSGGRTEVNTAPACINISLNEVENVYSPFGKFTSIGDIPTNKGRDESVRLWRLNMHVLKGSNSVKHLLAPLLLDLPDGRIGIELIDEKHDRGCESKRGSD